jgi:homoserine O-acetyltransferase/O-succinyltransferase
MKPTNWPSHLAAAMELTAMSPAALENYPTPRPGDWVARDFRFHTGEVLDLNLHYTTLGDPAGEPVLVLHGTGGSGAGLLTPAFAGEIFGPGQALDARKYFVILPDAIGAGRSSKPSDGLRTQFPRYNYDDMVQAQYRLVAEGLDLRHLRLVLGVSMGGMHTWLWGQAYPDHMDGLVPMGAQPSPMASRNWMLRRMLIETIRSDPEWKNGNYTAQPRSLKLANVFFGLATSGGSLAYQKLAPTRQFADQWVDARLAEPFEADANDFLYQWDASRDYDPSPGLARIEAPLLAINSADDERNPPESGIMDRAVESVKNGRLYLIPASGETRGHGTIGMARFWTSQLRQFLQDLPHRP